jgi:2-C-methyl-D-erythritol 4-phosphate cytidylyltransferase
MDYIIIVAGGKGLRMGGDIPKQFLAIDGRPALMRTIEQFRRYSGSLRIILVLPKAQQDYWQQLCRQYDFWVDYLLADGGATRFHSVQNGLALIPDEAQGVVGVHDGVRPFVSIDTIARCYDTAHATATAVPVTPVVETLRKLNGPHEPNGCPDANNAHKASELHSTSHTVPRSDYRLVQTPQCFDIQLLKAANRQPYCDDFTDDASVVEAFGQQITLVEGNRENIKITTPFDIVVANALAKAQQNTNISSKNEQ